MHEVIKIEKETLENLKREVEELKIYKENYQMLKKEIESLYNGFMCCEVSLHADEIEEI